MVKSSKDAHYAFLKLNHNQRENLAAVAVDSVVEDQVAVLAAAVETVAVEIVEDAAEMAADVTNHSIDIRPT